MDKRSVRKPMNRRDFLRLSALSAAGGVLAACSKEVEVTKIVETEKEVPVEVTKIVETEKEVPVEVTREVEKEVIVEVTTVPMALEPAHLNIWINWGGSWEEAITQITRGIEEKRPGLTVEILPGMSGTEGITKFLASLAGGNPPDLFNGHADDGYMFTSRGTIQPLDDYLTMSRISKDDFFEAQLNRYIMDGKLYGIPSIEGAAGQAMMWNKAMFEEVGLDPEVGPSTHEEIRAWSDMLEIFDDAGNVVRLGFHPRDGRGWSMLDWWFDLDWYDIPNHKVNLASENMIRGCEWVTDFYRHVGPEKMTAFRQEYDDSINTESAFVREAQAMFMGAYYHCRNLFNLETGIELGIDWVPTFDGLKTTTMRGWFWMIPDGSPHPDHAWQYIEDFTTVESAFTIFNVAGGWPSYKPFLEAASFEFEKVPGLNWMVNSPFEADRVAMNPPFPISLDEVDDRIDAGLGDMAFFGVSAEEMLTQIQEDLQKLVDQAIAAGG